MSVLIAAVETLTGSGLRMFMTIHQLLGHSPEQVAALGQLAHPGDAFLWLHDFFTLCPSVRLQRNDLEFCGAPGPASNACGICVYGPERLSHLYWIKHVFAVLTPTVVAPSRVTLEFWLGAATFRVAKSHVVPHLTLDWVPRGQPETPSDRDRIRVGFLGSAMRHKGWQVFEKMSYSPALSDRFDFIALTASKVSLRGKKISVNVSPEHPNAMADAVRQQEIDLVLHWPDWPETFALTAYEGLEGGAFVVTNQGSGNVAATVRQLDRGAVLENEEVLLAFSKAAPQRP